jgi:hypothetical protein
MLYAISLSKTVSLYFYDDKNVKNINKNIRSRKTIATAVATGKKVMLFSQYNVIF